MVNSVILVNHINGEEQKFNPEQFNRIPQLREVIVIDNIPCVVQDVIHNPSYHQTTIRYTRVPNG